MEWLMILIWFLIGLVVGVILAVAVLEHKSLNRLYDAVDRGKLGFGGYEDEPRVNKLTPAQEERLYLLLEEMGECQHAIGKVLRHGYVSYSSHTGSISNKDLLEKEIGDVRVAIVMLIKSGDVTALNVTERMAHRKESVKRWLHYQASE